MKAYTESDINKIQEMKASGKHTWGDIAKAIGRSEKSVTQKYYNTKREVAAANVEVKEKRKYAKRKDKQVPAVAVAAAPTTKPMIAFVGTPAEITAAIHGLFS